MKIHENPSESIRIYQNLLESIRIHQNLWKSTRIHENPLESIRIQQNPLESMRIRIHQNPLESSKSVRLKRKAKSIQLKRKGKSVRLKRKEHTQFPNSDSELKGSTRGQKIGTRIPPQIPFPLLLGFFAGIIYRLPPLPPTPINIWWFDVRMDGRAGVWNSG